MAPLIKQRELTPAAQLFGLKYRYPDGQGYLLNYGRTLRWMQTVEVHPLSSRYGIEIRQEQGQSPIVLVKEPDIEMLAEGRKLPHTFEKVDGLPSLCLWRLGDWNQTMPLSTIVGWAAEWFWFFEHWLFTGEWLGGGTHQIPLSPPKIISTINS